ncbi:MAG: hypothetical protein A2729_05665 [Candidatus Buchananbacteria bacterium RIFCSPHIGHO2_01_FULL_39_14]|uniref:UPF0235 protein A2912_02605 n=2 Tax=Candidatus Buchananiibacteriota TaxID=1817903 RepID=A0A1G1YSI2_9BACT|nr:MAG: hypothetical protein A2729_05665 [Candidatus Buchananbacteria bacterium RIFCSPHIGHO2_01_FULL_39_14]OGY55305.1 MAG: hypothetical protein A2912_02605 [Candidatus Buchananbacteria bacterium RIFCSPLOWO2_01_FULL_40_23b]
MDILVKVIPRSSKTEIIEQKENFLKIHLKAAPEKGKANRELINFLANHFKVAKSQIEILKGLTSKNKMIRLIKNQ